VKYIVLCNIHCN